MIITLFIYFTPNFKGEDNDYPFKYYLLCFFVFSIFYLIESTMFISNMAFFASRSDAVIGGTYITLLTTLSNLGNFLFFATNTPTSEISLKWIFNTN